MSDNRIVVYKGTGKVAVETLPYPKLEVPVTFRDFIAIPVAPDGSTEHLPVLEALAPGR